MSPLSGPSCPSRAANRLDLPEPLAPVSPVARKAEVDHERRGHGAGKSVGELEQHDEGQRRERVGPCQEFGERADRGLQYTFERGLGAGGGFGAYGLFGLGCDERRDGADQHQRRHRDIAPHPGAAARDAGRFKSGHDKQRARGRDQHADAIGRDVGRHAGGLFALRQTLDPECIDHDVLRRGHGRHQQRAERDIERRARGIGQRQQQDRDDQQQLRKHQPAAAAAEGAREQRHMQRVHQRRPQEFQRVGRADQREQPDGAEIDAGLAHPHQQRRPRQRQRQPGGEAEQQHDQHARLQIDGETVTPGGGGLRLDRCRGSGFGSGHDRVLADSDGKGLSRSLPSPPCGRGWIDCATRDRDR